MHHSKDLLVARLGRNFNLNRYLALLQTPDFENEVKKDLRLIDTWQKSDIFFQNHAMFIISLNLYNLQGIGIKMWLELLNRIYQIDPVKYDGEIHKGTPYYHAAIMSTLNHNYTEGFEWLDYAFEQDLTNTPERVENGDIPALWTLSFDPRLTEQTKPNDFGVTLKISNKVENLLNRINQFDSDFALTSSDLRNKVKITILAPVSDPRSTRTIRAAWAIFLGNIINQERILRYLNIAPKSGEAQLTVHKTLLEMTLILESFLKKAPCASGFRENITLWPLICKIVRSNFTEINVTGRDKNKKLNNITINKNYTQMLSDVNNLEVAGENKLAIAFTLSKQVRNNSHHLFNQEYISKDIFDALFIRISYAILTTINQLY